MQLLSCELHRSGLCCHFRIWMWIGIHIDMCWIKCNILRESTNKILIDTTHRNYIKIQDTVYHVLIAQNCWFNDLIHITPNITWGECIWWDFIVPRGYFPARPSRKVGRCGVPIFSPRRATYPSDFVHLFRCLIVYLSIRSSIASFYGVASTHINWY